MKKWKVVVVLVFVVGVGYQGYRFYKRHVHRPAVRLQAAVPVKVTRAELKNMTFKLDLVGNIEPIQEVNVYPKIAGEILQRLYVNEGDRVKAGQIIGEMEKETIAAKLNQAKAALNVAMANLSQIEAKLGSIKRDYERIKKLYAQKVVAKQRWDHIRAQYEATLAAKKLAIAQIKQAQAALKEVQILYSNHTIYAPISGLVTARYVDEGAMSDTKTPIVRITNDNLVKVVVAISEKDLPHVNLGQMAYIKVDAYPKRLFKGKIDILNLRIDPVTRTAKAEIYIANKDHLLKPGMFARVSIILGQKQVVAVPRDALQKMPSTAVYYLFVIDKGNVAHLRNVTTGISENNFVEIKKGLRAGEIVVVYGQNRLKEGTKVEVIQ